MMHRSLCLTSKNRGAFGDTKQTKGWRAEERAVGATPTALGYGFPQIQMCLARWAWSLTIGSVSLTLSPQSSL